jgi:hypothetical protein
MDLGYQAWGRLIGALEPRRNVSPMGPRLRFGQGTSVTEPRGYQRLKRLCQTGVVPAKWCRRSSDTTLVWRGSSLL